jgi:hypothetical protein
MQYLRKLSAISILSALVVFAAAGLRMADAQTQPAKPVATPTPPINEEEGVVKVDTEAVNVLFTAQDKNRRLLLTLKPSDFQIFENGQLQSVSARKIGLVGLLEEQTGQCNFRQSG